MSLENINKYKVPSIEFANIKSAELFKIDLEEVSSDSRLNHQIFMPLKKTEAALYEVTLQEEVWKQNQNRARIVSDGRAFQTNSTGDLLSFMDILKFSRH